MAAEVQERLVLRFELPDTYDHDVVVDAVVQLFVALDQLHRAHGGSGLRLEVADAR